MLKNLYIPEGLKCEISKEKFEEVIFYKNENLLNILLENKDQNTYKHIVGRDLYNIFLKISRFKGNVVAYVSNICDAIEPNLFSDANVYLYDLAEISQDKAWFLLEIAAKQKKRASDGYHDNYIEALYTRGYDG